MSQRFHSLRGFEDILPGASERWQQLEQRIRELMRCFAFREIRPPLVEATGLFTRSVGEGTDIVGKEMFTFTAGDESYTLRPEITASVCRALIEHGLDRAAQLRLYYVGPAFRKERPQKGRLRQFHQVGVELFGETAPGADVETIALAWELVRAAKVRQPRLTINSLGGETSRTAHRSALGEFLRARLDRLDPDSRERVDRNPLRVLDSKIESTKLATADAPSILEFLDSEERDHFAAVQAGLDQLQIPYEVDARLVRGLDYYVRTTFEIAADTGGSQNAVLGGGRYDNLLHDLGGPALAGVGFAAGIERILLASEPDPEAAPPLELFVVTLGESASRAALSLVHRLRQAGLGVLWDPAGRGLSAQLKRASRAGARFAAIVGDDELAAGQLKLKQLQTGTEEQIPLEISAVVSRLTQGKE